MSIHPNKAHFYAIFTGRTAVKQRLQSTGQRRRWQLGDHLGGEWTGRRGRRSSSSMTPTLCAAVVSSSHVSINRSRLTRAIYLSISSCVVWCCRCELPCRARRWGSFHRCRQWQGQLEKVMRRAGWTNGQREKTKDWPVFGGWFTAQAPDRKRVIYLESSPPQIPLWLSDYSGYSPPPWLPATPASCQSTQLMVVSYLLSVFLGASKCDKCEIRKIYCRDWMYQIMNCLNTPSP